MIHQSFDRYINKTCSQESVGVGSSTDQHVMATCPNSYSLQVPTISKSSKFSSFFPLSSFFILSVYFFFSSFPLLFLTVFIPMFLFLFLLQMNFACLSDLNGGDQVGYLTPTLRSRSPFNGCDDARRSKSTSRSFLQLPRSNQNGRCLSPSSPNNINDRSFLTPISYR